MEENITLEKYDTRFLPDSDNILAEAATNDYLSLNCLVYECQKTENIFCHSLLKAKVAFSNWL